MAGETKNPLKSLTLWSLVLAAFGPYFTYKFGVTSPEVQGIVETVVRDVGLFGAFIGRLRAKAPIGLGG